jgi:hypothetical protein
MAKIKKIGVLSFAKLHTLLGAIVGLILGVLYSFGGLLIDALVTLGWITSQETPGLSYGTVLAFGALIGMPAIFAGFGLAVGVIGAILYNLFARWFGGIEIDFKK